MDSAGVHKAISIRDPLFYWIHLTNGEQYLIPFVCQRCGNCCRMAVFYLHASCGFFEEPNICTVYDRRPFHCRGFPVYNGSFFADIVCQGYELSQKAIAILSQGVSYRIDFGSGDEFKPPTGLRKVIAKFEKASLPAYFTNRFLELNS